MLRDNKPIFNKIHFVYHMINKWLAHQNINIYQHPDWEAMGRVVVEEKIRAKSSEYIVLHSIDEECHNAPY